MGQYSTGSRVVGRQCKFLVVGELIEQIEARLDGNDENTRLAQVLDVEQILRDVLPQENSAGKSDVATPQLRLPPGTVVLAADDSAVARMMIEEGLKAMGVPYIMTKTGQEAWDRLQAISTQAVAEGKTVVSVLHEISIALHADELVVMKQYPSAFFGTSLASTLTAMGVDSVLLTGLTTSGCVRASCVDAMSHGFPTAVIADACGDRHAAPHEANLFDMNAKYADVVSEADVLAYLSTLKGA